jgi:murein DD-endopeptidase MepM/ murein hydrolase activator NlpD
LRAGHRAGKGTGVDEPYDRTVPGRVARTRATRAWAARVQGALLGCLALLTLGVPADPGADVRPAAAAADVGGAYLWPVSGHLEVSRPFEPPARRWLPGHRGVDLVASGDAVVRAAGAGVVRFAGPVAGRSVVSVDHAGGLRTTYEPLAPLVSAGDVVRAGDPIGLLVTGHPGCPARACLHWGLRDGDGYLDPLALLGLGRARLLPRP